MDRCHELGKRRTNRHDVRLPRHRRVPLRRRAAAATRAPTTTMSPATRGPAVSSTTGGSTPGIPRLSPTRSSAGPASGRRPFTCQEHAGDWESDRRRGAVSRNPSRASTWAGAPRSDLRALRAARPPALVLLGEDARAGVGEPRRRRLRRSARWSGTGSFSGPSTTTGFAPSRSSPATATPRTRTCASAAAGRRWGRCPRPA